MNEIRGIESYIKGTLTPGNNLVMEARLIIDKELQEKMLWQQRTYELVNAYSRKKLKQEIEQIHLQLFSENRFMSFREKIKSIFK